MSGSKVSYKEIATRLALELDLPEERVRKIIEVFFASTMGKRVINNRETILWDFGSFKLNRRGKMFLKRKKAAVLRIRRLKERRYERKIRRKK